jgi:hypothetical protein
MRTVAEIKAEILKLKPAEVFELGRRVDGLIKKLPRRSEKKAFKTGRLK